MQNTKFYKQTIHSVPLSNQTVLLRTDYNVPLSKHDGSIDDDYRLKASLPTLNYLLERNCKVVICAHLGRPKGQRDPKYSLQIVASRLAELLGKPVKFVPDCIGDVALQGVKAAGQGQVVLLENLRFYPGEEANDMEFAKELAKASGAKYFVQDGFGVVHRAHASTSAITTILPSVASDLLQKEWQNITSAVSMPERPMVAVLGGAKISDKIAVIEKMIAIADAVIVGGAMANTFLKYRGVKIGKSVTEDGLDGVLDKIYQAARQKTGQQNVDDFIVLPSDVSVCDQIAEGQRRITVDVTDVRDDEYILDLGSDSIAVAEEIIESAKTVIWSGTLGYAELPEFARASARVALAMTINPSVETVVGGGDTVDFVLRWDSQHGASFDHVSTGGSASLDLMAGQKLPGIESLLDAN